MSPGSGLLAPLLLLSAAGCAGVSPETVRQDLLAGRSPGRYVTGVPFIPQLDNYCGPASLAMVLQYWGELVGQEEIGRELYLGSVKGTLNLELEFYARRRGYRAESFGGTLEAVKAEIDRGRPLVVFQDQGIGPLAFPHFFVVIGYDDARELIVAHSGVTENRLIPYREFLWTWGRKGNWTLRVLPRDGQRPAGSRRPYRLADSPDRLACAPSSDGRHEHAHHARHDRGVRVQPERDGRPGPLSRRAAPRLLRGGRGHPHADPPRAAP